MWYYYLKDNEKSLLKKEKIIPNETFVVCKQEKYRKFRAFEDLGTFYQFMIKEEKPWYFYEVITDGSRIKPFFDIDLPPRFKIEEYDTEVINLANKISSLIEEENVPIIYSSSRGSALEKKVSYHIILDKVYFEKIEYMKGFFDYCKQKIEPENEIQKGILDSFDSCVYKSTQQFRLLWSVKFGANVEERIKLPIYGNSESEVEQFKESILTYISESVGIARYYRDEEKVKRECITFDVGDELIELVLEKVKDYHNLNSLEFCFDLYQTVNNMLILKRIDKSECIICKRVHENENAYITISPGMGKCLFFCRRNDEQRLEIDMSEKIIVNPVTMDEIIVKDEKVAVIKKKEDEKKKKEKKKCDLTDVIDYEPRKEQDLIVGKSYSKKKKSPLD